LNKNFFQQPYEIIFRAFSESIKLIGKRYYSVRGKKLDRIIDNIKNDKFLKVTLGGCIIKKVNQTVIISKEQ
jgi:tRNA(Ile)-lysidine synthase